MRGREHRIQSQIAAPAVRRVRCSLTAPHAFESRCKQQFLSATAFTPTFARCNFSSLFSLVRHRFSSRLGSPCLPSPTRGAPLPCCSHHASYNHVQSLMLGVFVWTYISSCSLVPWNYLRVLPLRNRIRDCARIYLATIVYDRPAIRMRNLTVMYEESSEATKTKLGAISSVGRVDRGEHLSQVFLHLSKTMTLELYFVVSRRFFTRSCTFLISAY